MIQTCLQIYTEVTVGPVPMKTVIWKWTRHQVEDLAGSTETLPMLICATVVLITPGAQFPDVIPYHVCYAFH